jgi:hypothetical protein
MIQGETIDTLNVFTNDSGKVVLANIIPDGGVVSLFKMSINGVEDVADFIPDEIQLFQNYPNPFNPSTSIRYSVSSRQFVSLKVYDVLGIEIATLVNEEKNAGIYEVDFSKGLIHQTYPSGVYFYQLRAGDPSTGSGQSFVETKKMILMK